MGTKKSKAADLAEGAQYGLLNLQRREVTTFIYRIIPKDRLLELFQNQENVLPAPWRWQDPFENFVLKSPARVAGQLGTFSFHDDFYGQCWTLHKASDAMWRIYSPNREAVRIRTTIDKLAKGLATTLGKWAHVQSYIGKVDYLSESKLKKFARTIFKDGLEPIACARSLLIKRTAFVHEREVRLLHLEKDSIKHPDGLYRYPIDPHSLIDQLMVDPRLPKASALKFADEIRATTNFQGDVKRSLLYAPPEGFVVEVP